MKIGLYSDAHYSSQELTCGKRRNSLSLEKIREAYRFFAEQGCDLCVSLGDLIDREETHEAEIRHLKEIGDVIASSGMKTICLMGNHDAFAFEEREYYEILDGCRPENRIVDGKRLIFLDSCYTHGGRHYIPGDDDWTDCFLPGEMALSALLDERNEEAVLFLHHNIDPAVPSDHRLANADSLFARIRDSGKVKTVFQGHYHPGMQSLYDGISYITFPALCENDAAFFLYDTEKGYRDPLAEI